MNKTHQTINKLQQCYLQLNKNNIDTIREVYSENIFFEDPFKKINGIDSLQEYMQSMYDNLIQCEFDYGKILSDDHDATILWVMKMRHKSFNGSKEISLNGCTHLVVHNEKVIYHKDYFDSNALIFEHIPVLSWIIKTIKKQL